MQKRMLTFLPAGLLLAVSLLAFGGSIFHGFAAVDDEFVVVYNLAIRGLSFENIKTVFSSYDPEIYIPLTFLSFQLNYLLDGLNPATFHAGNLLLHAVNSYLVYRLLLLLSSPLRPHLFHPTRPPRGEASSHPRGETSSIHVGALFGALVFAVHPLFTQSVVWITGRKDVLCTLFVLLSFIFYLRYKPSLPEAKSLPAHSPQPRGLASCHPYVWSLFFFLFALLSKPTAMTLPVVLVLYDVLLQNQRLKQSLSTDKLPYLALAIMFAVITVLGKERLLTLPLIFDAVLLGSKSVLTYLQHFLIPTGFSFFYPFRGDVVTTNPGLLVPLLLVVAGTVASIIYSKKFPKIAFGILSFLIILSPTFLNLQTGGFTFFAADRFAYLPGIGLIVALVATLERFDLATRGLASVGGTILLTFLILTSQVETRYWKEPKQLFSRALELYPASVSARIALASLERQDGKFSRAFEILREGLAYGDDMNLRIAAGIVYANTGRVEDAIEQFETARRMAPQNPEPLFSLGAVYEQTGRKGEAMGLFEEAVRLDPSYVAARIHLADLLRERGELQDAKGQLEQALTWNRNSGDAHRMLAEMLEEEGQRGEAEEHRRKAEALRYAL